MGVRQRGLRHAAEGLASARRLLVTLVGGNVEGDEEDEVRGEDADSGDGGEFFARALAGVGEPREVGAGEVGVGGEVDEACNRY